MIRTRRLGGGPSVSSLVLALALALVLGPAFAATPGRAQEMAPAAMGAPVYEYVTPPFDPNVGSAPIYVEGPTFAPEPTTPPTQGGIIVEPGWRYHERHTHDRAGYPLLISPHASYAITPKYIGYYVGGGSPKPPPCPPHQLRPGHRDKKAVIAGAEHPGVIRQPGTFGLDFRGSPDVPRFVYLFTSEGRKTRGGYGAYKTDGPHVPDIFAMKLFKVEEAEEEEEHHEAEHEHHGTRYEVGHHQPMEAEGHGQGNGHGNGGEASHPEHNGAGHVIMSEPMIHQGPTTIPMPAPTPTPAPSMVPPAPPAPIAPTDLGTKRASFLRGFFQRGSR